MKIKMNGKCIYTIVLLLIFFVGENAANNLPSERIDALRRVMIRKGADAIIIPTADAHLSPHPGPSDAHITWLNDFTGSAGTVLVTQSSAGLWTDGRYTIQANNELDLNIWTLRDTSLSTTPTLTNFLLETLGENGGRVIVNGNHYSHTNFEALKIALERANIRLESDLTAIAEARMELSDEPVERIANEIISMPITVSGRSVMEKVAEVRQRMAENNAHAFVVCALDSVAYLTNLRGSDIPYNPVFFSYIILTANKITVFVQEAWIDEAKKLLLDHGVQVNQLEVENYNNMMKHLEELSISLACHCPGGLDCAVNCQRYTLWVPHHYPQALHEAAKGNDNVDIITGVSPIVIMKVTKNEVEVQGMVETHEKDGTAVVRLLHYLDVHLKNNENISEYEAARIVDNFRSEEVGFFGMSFSTISGAGPNAAIVHYNPTESQARMITANEIFLIDSGGQFTGGTTDVTRTVHYGTPSADEIEAYTLVLKGQIAVATSVIPYGTMGAWLDAHARRPLWAKGLDYSHGTGHGVGHRLNVHEGPIGIYQRSLANDPGFGPNMFVSDEPGYYLEGRFGIRIEDVIQSVVARAPGSGKGLRQDIEESDEEISDFGGVGALAFRKITLAPLALNLINISMLDAWEIQHVDEYNSRVNRVIGDRLRTAGHYDAADWLAASTISLAAFNGSLRVAANIILIGLASMLVVVFNY